MAKCKARFIKKIAMQWKLIYDRVDVRISVSYLHTCFIYSESHTSVRSDGGGGGGGEWPYFPDSPAGSATGTH